MFGNRPIPGSEIVALADDARAEIDADGPCALAAAAVLVLLACIDTRAAGDDLLDLAIARLGKRRAVALLGAVQRRSEIVADIIELREAAP